MILKLAWRNVRRGGSRCILATVSAAAGAAALVFMTGFVDGMGESIVRLRLDTEMGEVTLRRAGYEHARDEEQIPLAFRLPSRPEIGQALRALPAVVAASPRLVFPAQLNDGFDSLPIKAVGFEPASEEGLFAWKNFVVSGRPPRAGEEGDVVWVGERLLPLFKAEVGSYMTLLARTPDETMTCLDLEVVGAVKTGNAAVDNFSVFLPLSRAQDMLDLPGEATEWVIRSRTQARSYPDLKGLLPRLPMDGAIETRTWYDETEGLRKIQQIRRTSMYVLVGVLLTMAVLGIANITLMAIYERAPELGTMAALGLRPRQILMIIVLEAGLVGLAGGVVGAAFGSWGTLYFERVGVDVSQKMGKNHRYAVGERIYASYSKESALWAMLICGLAGAGAAWWPARQASLRDPVLLLRAGRNVS